MAKWLEDFELITSTVRIDGDDRVSRDEEHSSCMCKPQFTNSDICFDRSCINFCMQTECLKCKPNCQNNRFQKRKYAKLDVRETPGKGFGLFACEDLKKGQFLMEYLGELVTSTELTARMDAAKFDKHLYVLQVKPGNFLDARHKGTIGRFINHSCEPNCVTELWTVDGHIRVGIFTSKDVEKDTELNFDYQWRPSSRAPTKCHCGTASCRGYLEVMTQEEVEDLKVRKGLWRNKKDDLAVIRAKKLSNSTSVDSNLSEVGGKRSPTDNKDSNTPSSNVFDDFGRLIPKQMIHKRVKIWWEGNQAYFEADIMDYIEKTNRYVCYYIMDDTTIDENLSDVNSDWYWLDETQDEVLIKKKDISMFADAIPMATDMTSEPVMSGSNSSPRPQVAFIQASRAVVKIEFQTALNVVLTAWSAGGTNSRIMPEEMKSDRKFVWTQLFTLLKEHYQVDGQFAINEKAPDFEDLLEKNDTQAIVLIGSEDIVKNAKHGILTACETQKTNKMYAEQQEREQHYNRQSIILTNDWRLMPTIHVSRKQEPPSQVIQHAVSLLNAMTFESEGHSAHLISQSLLPKVTINPNANSSVTISDNVRSTLLDHLIGLTVRLKYSQAVCYSSCCLLIRYLRFCSDNVVKDSTNLIAAIVVISLKSRDSFKFKMLRKIVQSAYCQVFEREEASVGHSADTFIPKVLEIEQTIQSKLFGDVYVSDVEGMVLAAAYQHIREKKNKSSSDENGHSHHDKKHKRVSEDDSQAYLTKVKNLLEEGFVLSTTLLSSYPTLLNVLPTEALQLSCMLIISLMETLLTSNSVVRFVLPTSKEVPESLATILFALTIQHGYSDVLSKSVELLTKIIGANLYNIHGINCFTNKEMFENNPVTQLVSDCVPKLFIKWLKYVQSKQSEEIVHPVNKVPPNTPVTPAYSVNVQYSGIPQPPVPPQFGQFPPPAYPGYPPVVTPMSQYPSNQFRTPAPPTPPTISRPSTPYVATKAKKSVDVGYKLRLPWITEEAMVRSNLLLSDLTEINGVNKEVYNGMVSIEGMLRVNAGHILNHVGYVNQSEQEGVNNELMPLSFRAWPSLKTLIRDIKKSEVSHPSELGTVASAMNELCLLQHLHYHYSGPASDNQSHPTKPASPSSTCPYFVEPFGILTVTATEWHQPATSQLLFGKKFDANHEYFESLKDTPSAEDNSFKTPTSSYSNNGRSLYSDGGETDHSRDSRSLLSLLQDDTRQSALMSSQINAVKEKKFALPDVNLSFLLMAPIQFVLSSLLHASKGESEGDDRRKSGSGASESVVSLSPTFALQLCKDLLCAADHLNYCGVHLRWMSVDHLFVSHDGRLLIGNLSGASMATPLVTESVSEAVEVKSKHKKEHKKDKDASGNNNVPSNCLYTVAPELLLGGSLSSDSTMFTVGMLCAHILIGKPLIKNGSGEEKQLQYIYKVLGTPKIVGFKDFDQLPLASTYGRHIRADDDSMTESRSRAFKVIKSVCSSKLLSEYSYGAAAVNVNAGKDKDVEESDNGGVIDLIRQAVHLVPWKRAMPLDLLSLKVFHNALISAQNARSPIENYSKGELMQETLFLSNNQSVVVQSMNPQTRMLTVKQLVETIHKDNEKEIQRMKTLLKLAVERYPAIASRAAATNASHAAPQMPVPTQTPQRPVDDNRHYSASYSNDSYSNGRQSSDRNDYHNYNRSSNGSAGYSHGSSGGGSYSNGSAYGRYGYDSGSRSERDDSRRSSYDNHSNGYSNYHNYNGTSGGGSDEKNMYGKRSSPPEYGHGSGYYSQYNQADKRNYGR